MKGHCLAYMVFAVLLAVLLVGIASAGTVSTDAKSSMKIWSVGTESFLHFTYPGNLVKYPEKVEIQNIPAGGNTGFITPLTLPGNVNGNPSSISAVYLYWNAPTTCQITMMQVYTAGQMLYFAAPAISGTGSPHALTIDLGSSFEVPRGLTVFYQVHNSAAVIDSFTVYGYGTKIKYKE
jgi:hypothetical protein